MFLPVHFTTHGLYKNVIIMLLLYQGVKDNICDKKNPKSPEISAKMFNRRTCSVAVEKPQPRGHVNDKHAELCFNTYTLLHRLLLQLKLYKTKENIFTKSVCASMIFFYYILSLSLQFCIGMHRNKLWYNMLTKLKTISEIEMLQYIHVKQRAILSITTMFSLHLDINTH